ncbi:hypothetical protein BURKHO8Y_160020 [Burkholderia sp. 8Y]|nr:hypothetical protein BURKHO8Y_160020 [Burkholderia sp. 8Y]
MLSLLWDVLTCERCRARLTQELNREERDGKVRVRRSGLMRRNRSNPNASLRWHYPDQVQRVFLTHAARGACAR